MDNKKSCDNCAHWSWDGYYDDDSGEEIEWRVCSLMEIDEETPNYDWHIPVCDAWEDEND